MDKQIYLNTELIDALSPIAIEFNKNYFIFGDNYARVLLVTNYPSRVKIGWLSRIANLEGVTCSIHLSSTEPDKLIENISRSIGDIAGKINAGSNALNIQRWKQQYEDAQTLLQKIDREQENVFYINISIMVTAPDKETLDRRSRRVEGTLAGAKMRGRTAIFRQEQALNAVSPYNILPDEIKELANRNMPASTIAGSFPFDAAGINDGQGLIFGQDSFDGLIILDNWKRGGDRTNSNWTILGAPGVGKTATVKHLLLNEYALGTKIIIIDPEREYKEMCENLDGQWINCGGGEGGRINPLQIKDDPDEENTEERPLGKHFQILRTFFKLYLRTITEIEQAMLEEALEVLYKNIGITYESTSADISKIPNEDYPIIADLYKYITKQAKSEANKEKKDSLEKLSSLIRRIAVGADSSLWNGTTTLKADSDFIVLDTHDLENAEETVKRTQYFNILTWAWQQLSQNREEQVLLGVDEAYLLVDRDVPQALKFLRDVSKRIRKYNGGLVVISHSVVDFLDDSVRHYGQALLDNPCFKFFMGTDGRGLSELIELMNLTEAETDMIARKSRGEGLLICGSKRLHVKIKLSEYELEVFGRGGGR